MLASLLTLGLAALAYALPATELAERDSPDRSQVYIQKLTWGGSGCPANTVGNFTSDDRQTFTLLFDNFVAQIGPSVSPSEWRKNCQLLIQLHYPQGFQYSVLQTEYRGFISIDSTITAKQEALYYFSGESAQATCSVSFTGPDTEDYHQVGKVPLTSIVWSPCGSQAALNIDASVQLHQTSDTNAQGQMTIDSADGHIQFIVGVQWRKC